MQVFQVSNDRLTQTDPTEITEHNYYKKLDLKISITIGSWVFFFFPTVPEYTVLVTLTV